MSIPPYTPSLGHMQPNNPGTHPVESQNIGQGVSQIENKPQDKARPLDSLMCAIISDILDENFSSEDIEVYASSIVVDETMKELLISSQFNDLKESLEIQLNNFGITESEKRDSSVDLLKRSYVLAHRNSPIWWGRVCKACKWIPKLIQIADEQKIGEEIASVRKGIKSITENMSLDDLRIMQKELSQCKDKLIGYLDLQDYLSDSDNERICFLVMNAKSILYPQYEPSVVEKIIRGLTLAILTLGQKVKVLEPLINDVKSLLHQVGTNQVKLTQQRASLLQGASLLIEQSPSTSVTSEGEKMYNQYASGILDAFRNILCDLFVAHVADKKGSADNALMNLIKEHYQNHRAKNNNLPDYVEFEENPKLILGSHLNQNFVVECFDKYYEKESSIQLDSLAIAVLDALSDKERTSLLQELKGIEESKEEIDVKKGMIKTLIYSQMCPLVKKIGLKFTDFSGLQGSR